MAKFEYPTTPKNLFAAAQSNDEYALKYYVEEQNATVTTANHVGQTAAHVAAFNGNLRILKYLVGKDPSLVALQDKWNQTALHMAVENGSLDVVQFLVDECNADPHQHVCNLYFGNSVLHIAAEEGHLDVLKYFIEQKQMDANLRNSEGQPPAFLAANFNHLDIIQYLVENANADLTITDNRSRTILHMLASFTNNSLRVPKYLLDEKQIPIDVNARDSDGLTAVNSLCNYDHFELIKYLVTEKGADISLCDNVGRTPVHQAAYMNNMQLVSFFITQGADPTAKDKEGRSAMELTKRAEIAEYLEVAMWKQNPQKPTEKAVSPTEFLSPDEIAQQLPKEFRHDFPRDSSHGDPRYKEFQRNPRGGRPNRGYRGGPPPDYGRRPPSDYGRDPPHRGSRDSSRKPDRRLPRSVFNSHSDSSGNLRSKAALTELSGNGPASIVDTSYSHLGGIFLLAIAGTRYSKHSTDLIQSPADVIRNKMDSLAIDTLM